MWHTPEDPLPEDFYAGDRLVLVVNERRDHHTPPAPFLVLIEATEDGWRCDDETFNGYSPEDGVAWATERDVLRLAAASTPA